MDQQNDKLVSFEILTLFTYDQKNQHMVRQVVY